MILAFLIFRFSRPCSSRSDCFVLQTFYVSPVFRISSKHIACSAVDEIIVCPTSDIVSRVVWPWEWRLDKSSDHVRHPRSHVYFSIQWCRGQGRNSAVLCNLVRNLLEALVLSYHIAFQMWCHFNYLSITVTSPWWPHPHSACLPWPEVYINPEVISRVRSSSSAPSRAVLSDYRPASSHPSRGMFAGCLFGSEF